MSQARRSVSLSLADGALSLALQFAATVVVARLVAPADIGVFTLAALVLAIAGRLRDFGIGEYLVQAADDSPRRVRAAPSSPSRSSATTSPSARPRCAASWYRITSSKAAPRIRVWPRRSSSRRSPAPLMTTERVRDCIVETACTSACIASGL